MKKLLFVLLLLSTVPALAEKPGEVLLRYGRQDNMLRIVLEANDEFIKNTNAVASLLSVKIEFPAAFDLKKQKDFIFETYQKDQSLIINFKDITDVKTYKLTSPARLVIDLRTGPMPQKDPQQKSGMKPGQDTGQLPAQKTGKDAAPQDIQKTQQQTGHGTEKPHKIKICVIDPGHGGYDPGIISQNAKEKDINLGIAKDLSNVLTKKGVTVHLTRKADQSISLTERTSFSSGKKPDIFIALHASGSDKFAVYTAITDDPNADASVRMYSLSARQSRHIEKSRSLSRAIGSSLGNEFKTAVVARELPLPVLSSSDAPSVLIEYPLTNKYTWDQKMRDRIVKALMIGITAYEQ